MATPASPVHSAQYLKDRDAARLAFDTAKTALNAAKAALAAGTGTQAQVTAAQATCDAAEAKKLATEAKASLDVAQNASTILAPYVWDQSSTVPPEVRSAAMVAWGGVIAAYMQTLPGA